MVTFDELRKRKDEDAQLMRVMLNWLIDLNEYDHVSLEALFEFCRDEAISERN